MLQRKKCQKCRLNKCLAMGMQIENVSKRKKKVQLLMENSGSEIRIDEMESFVEFNDRVAMQPKERLNICSDETASLSYTNADNEIQDSFFTTNEAFQGSYNESVILIDTKKYGHPTNSLFEMTDSTQEYGNQHQHEDNRFSSFPGVIQDIAQFQGELSTYMGRLQKISNQCIMLV